MYWPGMYVISIYDKYSPFSISKESVSQAEFAVTSPNVLSCVKVVSSTKLSGTRAKVDFKLAKVPPLFIHISISLSLSLFVSVSDS